MTGGVTVTRASPKWARNKAAVLWVSALVLTVAGVASASRMVATGNRSWATPAASASPRAMRWIPSSRCRRTPGVKLRTVSCSRASSEMMLCLVPEWKLPTDDGGVERVDLAADQGLQGGDD